MSRNIIVAVVLYFVGMVTSREGRVSRNAFSDGRIKSLVVTSREGRVSRNNERA